MEETSKIPSPPTTPHSTPDGSATGGPLTKGKTPPKPGDMRDMTQQHKPTGHSGQGRRCGFSITSQTGGPYPAQSSRSTITTSTPSSRQAAGCTRETGYTSGPDDPKSRNSQNQRQRQRLQPRGTARQRQRLQPRGTTRQRRPRRDQPELQRHLRQHNKTLPAGARRESAAARPDTGNWGVTLVLMFTVEKATEGAIISSYRKFQKQTVKDYLTFNQATTKLSASICDIFLPLGSATEKARRRD